jgi:hypothetical protein
MMREETREGYVEYVPLGTYPRTSPSEGLYSTTTTTTTTATTPSSHYHYHYAMYVLSLHDKEQEGVRGRTGHEAMC